MPEKPFESPARGKAGGPKTCEGEKRHEKGQGQLLCGLLAAALLACALPAAWAAPAGDEGFIVEGDTSGYTYEEGVLTFTKAGEYTVRNKNQSVPTAHRIVINDTEGIDDIVVMLAGISILTQKEPAVSLEEGAGAFFRMMPGTENILACSTGAAVVGGKESDFKIACVDAFDTAEL